jgi:hypothetical protein
MYGCMLAREKTDRSERRTVLATEAIDGSDEVAMELAGPPEPGHLGPVVPPRRRPVPPTAGGATHLAHALGCRQPARPASSLSSVACRLSPVVPPCGSALAASLDRWLHALLDSFCSPLHRSLSSSRACGRPGCLSIYRWAFRCVSTL